MVKDSSAIREGVVPGKLQPADIICTYTIGMSATPKLCNYALALCVILELGRLVLRKLNTVTRLGLSVPAF